MSTRSLRRKALPLLLCAGLIASWASAATPRKPPGAARPAQASSSLLTRAWSFLQSLLSEEGCMLGPDGHCRTGTSQVQPTTDTGCMLDPSGRCHG